MFNSTSCVDDSKVNGRKGGCSNNSASKKKYGSTSFINCALNSVACLIYIYIYIYMSDLNEVTDKMIENQ